jgi:hypothetical protein
MMISSRSSAAVSGNLRIPKSSMISSRTVESTSTYCFGRALDDGLSEFFEQHVRLTIQDAIALQDCRLSDSLGQMTLARSAEPEEQGVIASRDGGSKTSSDSSSR